MDGSCQKDFAAFETEKLKIIRKEKFAEIIRLGFPILSDSFDKMESVFIKTLLIDFDAI